MKIRTKHLGEIIDRTVDSGCGTTTNVVTKFKERVFTTSKEQYCLMFLKFDGLFDDMDYCSARVMVWCMLNCSIDGNEIHLMKPDVDRICKKHNIGGQSVRNSISKLSKCGALIKKQNGVYYVHPDYSWRGDLEKRSSVLVEIVKILEYRNNGKEV